MIYARVTRAYTRKRTVASIARKSVMAGETSSKALADGPGNSPPKAIDDHDLLAKSTLDNNDSLLSTLTPLTGNMDRMASTMTAMGELFAALSQQQ